jgi:zinc/manganese transport system ATP-binding protein
MSKPLAEFRDVTLGYGSHPAVHHLSGTLAAGSMTAVLGANGSGKSTLLKGIAGLLRPLDGSIVISPGTSIAYLPQQSELDRGFPARVVDLVTLGLWQSRGLFARHTPADRKRVADAIEAVGLGGFETRGIDTLSGGQFQRALFARVLLQDAQLILLDEPFNAVDAQTVEHLLALVKAWRDQGRTVLAVLHDFDLAQRHFPQTLLLARRPVAWGPTDMVLTSANRAAARKFDEAWHDEAPWCATDEADGHHHGETAHEDHAHHTHGHSHAHGHRRAAE